MTQAEALDRCALCGKSDLVTTTPCCGRPICDDADAYVLFSYAANSCYHNHSRYTLCASHYNEDHHGDWKTCVRCRESFETELYVWYGTNEYNFERLKNPPDYEPTFCARCGKRIALPEGGYTVTPARDYLCYACDDVTFP